MTCGSILIDISDTESVLLPFSQTSRSSSHTPRSVFASLQPGLAWSSVGSHLTNQPPTGDVFDSSGFLMKWTLSACREFFLLAVSWRQGSSKTYVVFVDKKCPHKMTGGEKTILGLGTIIYGKGEFKRLLHLPLITTIGFFLWKGVYQHCIEGKSLFFL